MKINRTKQCDICLFNNCNRMWPFKRTFTLSTLHVFEGPWDVKRKCMCVCTLKVLKLNPRQSRSQIIRVHNSQCRGGNFPQKKWPRAGAQRVWPARVLEIALESTSLSPNLNLVGRVSFPLLRWGRRSINVMPADWLSLFDDAHACIALRVFATSCGYAIQIGRSRCVCKKLAGIAGFGRWCVLLPCLDCLFILFIREIIRWVWR